MKKVIRKQHEWNNACYRNKEFTDPTTGAVFDFSHMVTKEIELEYIYKDDKKNKIKGKIKALAVFDHHCYTSEINENDDRVTLVTDMYSDGSAVNRGFDQERYTYSHKLLKVIENLSSKLCRESRILGKSIRLEDRDIRNPKCGVYIIIKARPKPNNLMLYIETAHYRNNEPEEADLRKEPRKYMFILGDLLSKNRSWNHLI